MPLRNVYPLAGITPLKIRRCAMTCLKRRERATDQTHPISTAVLKSKAKSSDGGAF